MPWCPPGAEVFPDPGPRTPATGDRPPGPLSAGPPAAVGKRVICRCPPEHRQIGVRDRQKVRPQESMYPVSPE
ncbi:hypothetical protein SSP531S_10020 [Streptomyces spongiicola]|uniref:Uncharacterized protein n=1 Tax=Streptomyces spongiicola TaxID=1690221 RepID=A0A388SSJ7_9ACTN|nr:hypothetical protein SSP531S_10020 [Streptomyces spongiicola]